MNRETSVAEDLMFLYEEEKRRHSKTQSEYSRLIARVMSLFDVIKHGEEPHQLWLKEAIDAHFQDVLRG